MIRVVVVDDHAVVREGLKRILSESGDIAVTGEAADDREALALLGSAPCDVVVTDISMPGRGGLELIERCRARQVERRQAARFDELDLGRPGRSQRTDHCLEVAAVAAGRLRHPAGRLRRCSGSLCGRSGWLGGRTTARRLCRRTASATGDEQADQAHEDQGSLDHGFLPRQQLRRCP